jgi:hypothetical protein
MLYDYSIWRKMGSRGRLTLQDGGGGGPPPPNQNTSQTPNQHPLNNYISHVQNALNAYDWSTPPNISINQTPFPPNLVTQILDNQINQGTIPHHRLMSPNEMLATVSATQNTLRNLDNIAPFTPSESSINPEFTQQDGRIPASQLGGVLQFDRIRGEVMTRRGIPATELGDNLQNSAHEVDFVRQRREGQGYMSATELGKVLKNPTTTQGPPPSN